MKILFKKHWPLLGLGALLLLVAFYFARSAKDLIKTTAIIKDVVSVEGLKLKDIHYRQDDPDEKVKWLLDAEEVQFSEDRKIIRFYNFKLKVEPEGKERFRLNGKRGNYYKDAGKIELWGNLTGYYGTDYKIFTEYMLVTEKLGLLHTEKPVKIFGPFFNVKGKGLFADLKNEKVKILSNVTTIINEETEAR